MYHYIEILLRSDAEIQPYEVMNKVYAKLHKALHANPYLIIGVSFPQADAHMGNVIRLHGCEEPLAALMTQDWIGGMIGYCKVSEVLVVPDDVKHRTFSRVQQSSSASKLRRKQKRKKLTQDEVRDYRAKLFANALVDPYVEIVSNSTGRLYRRYIKLGKIVDVPTAGGFDAFGMSNQATVPWF